MCHLVSTQAFTAFLYLHHRVVEGDGHVLPRREPRVPPLERDLLLAPAVPVGDGGARPSPHAFHERGRVRGGELPHGGVGGVAGLHDEALEGRGGGRLLLQDLRRRKKGS